MWLLPYFLRGAAKSSYQARLSSLEDPRRSCRTKDQNISPYPEAIHYLLSTYTTTDTINEAENSVRRLRQHRFSVQEYAGELAERALKCGDVCDDNELISIFVEGLTDDIRRNVQHY